MITCVLAFEQLGCVPVEIFECFLVPIHFHHFRDSRDKVAVLIVDTEELFLMRVGVDGLD